jgi:hypothetical protein
VAKQRIEQKTRAPGGRREARRSSSVARHGGLLDGALQGTKIRKPSPVTTTSRSTLSRT